MAKNCKKCSNCGIEQSLSNFHKSKKGVLGVVERCRECVSLKLLSRTCNLVCESCGSEFTHHTSRRKSCLKCLPPTIKHCPEYCKSLTKNVSSRKEYKEKYYKYYRYICRRGLTDWLFEDLPMLKPIVNYCIEESKVLVSKCDGRKDFSLKHPSIYVYFRKLGKLEELFSDTPKKSKFWTLKECQDAASSCSSRSEFRSRFSSQYFKAYYEDWLDDICSHMTCLRTGWSREDFKGVCDQNNNGLGIVYLIKCWDADEIFYKIGVTSRTVDLRYTTEIEMPYEYSVLWEIKAEAGFVWDMELFYKQQTKKIRCADSDHELFDMRAIVPPHRQTFKLAVRVPLDKQCRVWVGNRMFQLFPACRLVEDRRCVAFLHRWQTD